MYKGGGGGFEKVFKLLIWIIIIIVIYIYIYIYIVT